LFKRLLVGAAVAALPLSLAALPASAAIPADGPATAANGWVETQSVEDGGGIKYTISVDWGSKYVDAAGNTRVSVNPLTVYRPDSTTPKFAVDDGLDLHFDVRNHGTSIIQHKVYDGLDLDVKADDQASFNPRNPISDAGNTDIRVKVGTDGDGKPSSVWVYFKQPAGL
jgi:hypothetical protein